VVLAACAGDEPDATDTTRPEGETTETTPAVDTAWERIVPGGDCECSDGSEFSFQVRVSDPKKVVFYLEDGGACFSAETCAEDDLYNKTVGEGPAGVGGIFDLADERNPFADHSFVYVPYCTGDVHLGNTITAYAPGLTVHHKGYVNGNAGVDHLVATFPAATDVVVIGESAGSIPAPLYAGLIADRLPEARITVLADSSGAYPDAREINDVVAPAWKADTTIPSWPENQGLTDGWSFPGLFVRSGRHDPEIVFARHDYASDETQASFLELVGLPADDLASLIDRNEAQIESAGVNMYSYLAPGGEHTVLSDGPLYREEVNGQSLVDWVARLIAGEPIDDVHCTECGSGGES
jgi:hypothetical protein